VVGWGGFSNCHSVEKRDTTGMFGLFENKESTTESAKDYGVGIE
jgi:hypothetical protein